ncbi:uncharacterized protein KY384_007354 [Bacidia gigantensis]|uniref:uncharacterized protein n=1 Tax=Bacidia gigantensis TaxID=2732470 RepID=UPI001D04B8C2|nr:uncharacterized protein KY384_007354 [Bacidia gigantensis]KAG8528436.1 hypothetical protein KY384_007354 [Bacidia gigantensis]
MLFSSTTLFLFGAVIQLTNAALNKISYNDTFDAEPDLDDLNFWKYKCFGQASGALCYSGFTIRDYYSVEEFEDIADTPPRVLSDRWKEDAVDPNFRSLWKPTNESVVSYDEKSIALACIVRFPHLKKPDVPEAYPCTIQLVGKKLDKEHGIDGNMTLQYNGFGNYSINNMTLFTFGDDFKGLVETSITFSVDPPDHDWYGVNLLVDTHAYDAYFNESQLQRLSSSGHHNWSNGGLRRYIFSYWPLYVLIWYVTFGMGEVLEMAQV